MCPHGTCGEPRGAATWWRPRLFADGTARGNVLGRPDGPHVDTSGASSSAQLDVGAVTHPVLNLIETILRRLSVHFDFDRAGRSVQPDLVTSHISTLSGLVLSGSVPRQETTRARVPGLQSQRADVLRRPMLRASTPRQRPIRTAQYVAPLPNGSDRWLRRIRNTGADRCRLRCFRSDAIRSVRCF